ncbi:hypothetical protein FSARC_3870 [Fusarium sarcochroum]|uniref:F-box domain-containing protein n=1 Tax=Fusarium sarcochroum TaxID=1208366 RepID=A0A8H4U2Y0_9HYPO|nr:hypothetical protein FSARC_3870 [Fusarium sarcochroum]
MYRTIYCVMCGCPFVVPYRQGSTPAENNWSSADPTEDESKQWLSEFRILGSPSSIKEYATPDFYPTRNESEIPGVFISGPAESYYEYGRGVKIEGRDYVVLAQPRSSNHILFPIHTNCLDILQRALAWRAEQKTWSPSLLDVYETLCAKFARNFTREERKKWKKEVFHTRPEYMDLGLAFETKYYGARDFWTVGGWEPTNTNETVIVSSDQKRVEEDSDTSVDFGTLYLNATPRSSLEGLPTEILDLITSFLPVPDVLRLQRCSKTLLLRMVLDQKFWRTNLLKGRLVPYIWDLECFQENLKNLKGWASSSEALDVCDWKSLAKMLDMVIGG